MKKASQNQRFARRDGFFIRIRSEPAGLRIFQLNTLIIRDMYYRFYELDTN